VDISLTQIIVNTQHVIP